MIPDSISMDLLDRFTLHSLRTLPDGLAELVGRHLAAAASVLAEDPALALEHAKAASRRAGRVAVVREAAGVAAYSAGEFAMALSELRAAARISGSPDYLPMMADCERGLGRPERALELAASPEVERLDQAARVEMLIVEAGARLDLGQIEAAVLTLQIGALDARSTAEWLPRLRYAYADSLLAAGRVKEARHWFRRAAAADPEQATDALERVDEIDGLIFGTEEESDHSAAVAVVPSAVVADSKPGAEPADGVEPEAAGRGDVEKEVVGSTSTGTAGRGVGGVEEAGRVDVGSSSTGGAGRGVVEPEEAGRADVEEAGRVDVGSTSTGGAGRGVADVEEDQGVDDVRDGGGAEDGGDAPGGPESRRAEPDGSVDEDRAPGVPGVLFRDGMTDG